MISLMDTNGKGRIGYFKSYKAIGDYLANHGETGKYYAIPKNITSLAGMKEINVINHGFSKDDDAMDIEIEMEGSRY